SSAVPNHLFVIHMPSSIAPRAGYWRPSVIDGVDNRRFKVDEGIKGKSWGRTINLEGFAKGANHAGGSEQVFLRLEKGLFEPDEEITFDYLGSIKLQRGTHAGIDDDSAFVDLVRNSRDLKSLVAAVS